MTHEENSNRNWFLISLFSFLFLRTVIIYFLYLVTGGNEFTMDRWIFELGFDPLSVLTFSTDASNYSQPPLFPIILAPFAYLTTMLTGEFLAARISFTLIEFCGFLMLARYLFLSEEIDSREKKKILLIFSFSPIGFMAGAVMRTEEAIVMVFTIAVLLAIKKRSIKMASFLTFLGAITGKILFGVVFLPLFISSNNKKDVLKWGIFPLAAFLMLYCTAGYLIAGTIPFIEFSPRSTAFCISIFTFFQQYIRLSGIFMKWISLGLVLSAFMIIVAARKKTNQNNFPGLMLISFLILFLLFYHITPEYLIFMLPLLAILPAQISKKKKRIVFNFLHIVLGVCSTAFGIAYGLNVYSKNFGYVSPSKDLALKIYNSWLGFIPIELFEKSMLVMSIATLFSLLLFMLFHIRNNNNDRLGTRSGPM